MYNRLGEEGTGVLKSAPFYMVREALFSLDSIEIGFEKAWVINLLVRFIRFVQKHVELKLTKTISSRKGTKFWNTYKVDLQNMP